jgi:ribosomal protein S18 acetylase RimI-like enzyme
MIVLEEMDGADFQEYLKFSIENYANEKVKAGTWKKEEAEAMAGDQLARILPQGKETPNHFLFNIVEMDNSRKAGVLWLGILESGRDYAGAYVWDIVINPEFRGKGYGKQAMIAAEEKAKALGQRRITLHVFGHNTVAINLYKSTGFNVTDLIMSKEI